MAAVLSHRYWHLGCLAVGCWLWVCWAERVYVPNERAPSFEIPLLHAPYVLRYDANDPESSRLPLLVWATDFANSLWSQAALLSDDSVRNFLGSRFRPGNASYLFVPAHNISDMFILRNRLFVVATTLGISSGDLDCFLFANITLSDLEQQRSELHAILQQWRSYETLLEVSAGAISSSALQQKVTIRRLDCYWPNCGRLKRGVSWPVVYLADDPCLTAKNATSLEGAIVLVPITTCPYDEAAFRLKQWKASGAVFIMPPTRQLPEVEQIFFRSENGSDLFISAITHEDGEKLSQFLSSNETQLTLDEVPVMGRFFLIDDAGYLQEVGSSVNADMMIAAWAAQYEYYQRQVRQLARRPSYVVPIFQQAVAPKISQGIAIPSVVCALAHTVSMETEITCPGAFDSDCAAWDHCVTITVSCKAEWAWLVHNCSTVVKGGDLQEVGGAVNEIARFVTPFRAGHWWTNATSYLPLLCSACDRLHFAVDAAGGPWLVTSSLHFQHLLRDEANAKGDGNRSADSLGIPRDRQDFRLIDRGQSLAEGTVRNDYAVAVIIDHITEHREIEWKPFAHLPLFSIFQPLDDQFNVDDKNVGNALQFSLPAASSGDDPPQIELSALITTHGYDQWGCCEFLPTRHSFIVNNVSYNLTFWDAGTMWGCADRVLEGSEPNEYGTWWYGRGGWCDGMDVKPWIVDISAALLTQGPNHIRYQAFVYDVSSQQFIAGRHGQTGYVIHSSHLTYYQRIPKHPTSGQDDDASHHTGRSADDSQTSKNDPLVLFAMAAFFLVMLVLIAAKWSGRERLRAMMNCRRRGAHQPLATAEPGIEFT